MEQPKDQHMKPGDVNDKGKILAWLPDGEVFVTPKQAERAKQFGWDIIREVRSDLVIVRRFPGGSAGCISLEEDTP